MVMNANPSKKSLTFTNPSLKSAARMRSDSTPNTALLTNTAAEQTKRNIYGRSNTTAAPSSASVEMSVRTKEEVVEPSNNNNINNNGTTTPEITRKITTSDATRKGTSACWEQMPENFVMVAITAKLLQERVVASNPQARSRKRQVRSAIKMMLVIVTSYLICNSLHIALVILEQFFIHLLYSEEDDRTSTTFYATTSDLLSFLYMFCSAMRIVVYFVTNLELRKDIQKTCCCLSQNT